MQPGLFLASCSTSVAALCPAYRASSPNSFPRFTFGVVADSGKARGTRAFATATSAELCSPIAAACAADAAACAAAVAVAVACAAADASVDCRTISPTWPTCATSADGER